MVERNGLQSRVRLSMKAVSEISQPRSFHVPELERKRPTASLIDSEMSDLAVRSIEVECVSLDETIRHDLSPLVFKIDVEGAEHLALAGMRKTLRDRHPIVIMECLPGARVAEIERELTPLSYAIWHLTPEGPERREGIIPDQTKRANNWLFVPPSHEKLVGDIFADMGSSSD
jgi:FkbM family methyltransferase